MRNLKITYTFLLIISLGGLGCSINQTGSTPSVRDGDAGVESQTAVIGVRAEAEEIDLSPAEYIHWIEDPDNGFISEKNLDDFTFSLQFRPHDYIACRELGKPALNAASLAQKIGEIEGLQYYNFKIASSRKNIEQQKAGATSDAAYEERIKYFSFNMQDDLQLVDGNDTLPCTLFHFERTYGAAPYSTFVLGFPALPESVFSNKSLIYEDRVFKTGTIKLTLPLQELSKKPKLKLP